MHAARLDAGGGGWIRTNVGVSQQIYSLPPLTTRAPLRGEPQIIVAGQRLVKLGLEVAAKQRQKRVRLKPHRSIAECLLALTYPFALYQSHFTALLTLVHPFNRE